VLLLGLASTGYAVDPPYLDAWPSVDRVLADNLGADTDDTMARQMAALNVFNASIEYKVLATFSRWLAGGADARWS
jgi:hypothetical protein